jgi:hypothetical protein
MTKSNALIPTSQKTIVFYDDEITAVVIEGDGEREIYVPLRPLCDYLGVSWQGQNRRINDDEVLSDVVRSVNITLTDLDPSTSRPRTSQMICLSLGYLNGWLFGINPKRVKPEVKDRLIRYQKECYKVLAKEFVQTAVSPTSSSSLMHVREMGLAIARMAEEQMEFDRRLGVTEATMQETAVTVDGMRDDIELLKARTDPGEAVTQSQAMQISQAVKAVARELGKQTKRNEYGGVYGELYRRYEITSYKELPSAQFDECLAWLTDWHKSLTSDNPF